MFCKWCHHFQFTPLPSSEYYVALYLSCLEKERPSTSKINNTLYGISHAHKLAGFQNPCNSPLVTFVKEGLLRSVESEHNTKEPVSDVMLKQIAEKYEHSSSLLDMRFVSMTLLSFAGFLRFNEVISLRRSDVLFKNNCIELNIRKSKTDQFKKGHIIYISKTYNASCPVKALQKYLSLAGIPDNSDEFLFRKVSYCKKSQTHKLRKGKALSYTRAREIFLFHMSELGLDKDKYGLHSLRSGGATAAATRGVSDRLIKKHGRWKSDKAKDGYVRENDLIKKSVTLNIGL